MSISSLSTASNSPGPASMTNNVEPHLMGHWPILSRRTFLHTTACAAGLAAFKTELGAGETGSSPPARLIDVNVNLSRWPLRRLPDDDTPALVAQLRAQGVSHAWAGTFDGLLHKDLASANARLVEECRRHGQGLLVPFGSVNPMLPDWEEDLRRCAEEHRMPGIRLHPNYHGYALDDPVFARLLRLATDRHLIVQVALLMEDERMMHPRLRIPPVNPAPLANLIPATPGLRLVLLNALTTLRGQLLKRLTEAGEVSVEISMLEGVGGVGNLLQQIPPNRVLFGSHAPLFYFAAAALKLKESLLTGAQSEAIRNQNARQLLSMG